MLLNSLTKPPRPRSTPYAVFTPNNDPTPDLILLQLALANWVRLFVGAAPITAAVEQLRVAGERIPASLTSTRTCGGSLGPEAYISANFSRGSPLSCNE